MRTTLSISTPVIGALLLTASCATTTPGAHPHDMSASQHEAMASREERAATGHASQYDPSADRAVERCPSERGTPLSPCWTDVVNPTAEHAQQADAHRNAAAEHRAASQALRDAEERACAGIPEADRDMSPFEHRADIASVAPLSAKPETKTLGAVVTLRAVPGLTAEWLERDVKCHLARNAALGHVVPEMPDCPLVPRGVEASVTASASGFAVTIRAEDEATARDVLRRAEALAKR